MKLRILELLHHIAADANFPNRSSLLAGGFEAISNLDVKQVPNMQFLSDLVSIFHLAGNDIITLVCRYGWPSILSIDQVTGPLLDVYNLSL